MSHPVKGIDHCFVLTDDLDAAARQYAALGFTLSPRGLHSEAKGSANHTIMFAHDYLELLGLVRSTEANAARRQMLADRGEGLHAIACRIDAAEAAARELTGLGIATEGLGSFERPVPLPGGGEAVAAFSTLSFAPAEVPFGTIFMCEHKTPETVWLPELLTHPNTARGLSAILAISAEPATDAARFALLWAAGRAIPEDGAVRVETGARSAPLILCRAADMARLYPGIDLSRTARGAFTAVRVEVESLEAARSCLAASGIAPVETARGLAVPPGHAAGCVVEFVP